MAQQATSQATPIEFIDVPRRRAVSLGSATPYLLIAPAFAVMLGVIFYPIASNIWASFMGEQTLSRPSTFVGLEHYRKVINDPVFMPALRRTLIWAFGV